LSINDTNADHFFSSKREILVANDEATLKHLVLLSAFGQTKTMVISGDSKIETKRSISISAHSITFGDDLGG
jgi:hypothetical protein